MGSPMSKDVISSWSADMVKFYHEECTKRVKRNVTLEEKLKTKISDLEAELVLLNRNLLVNARMNAQRMVKDSEEATGEKVNGLYDEVFYQTYKAKILKVKDLQWEKIKSEVEWFLLSRNSFTKDMQDMWTNDMIDYYLERYTLVFIGHGLRQTTLNLVQYVYGSVAISSSAHYADAV
ncbi:hypothetical protein Tco_1090708 [Tanacetum coccineum]|uniref:Uncharacterized protein n=1 Tax=Tanacetum coccineum TaxID=301880 RepID=A0ABQ5I6B6_9ASTR